MGCGASTGQKYQANATGSGPAASMSMSMKDALAVAQTWAAAVEYPSAEAVTSRIQADGGPGKTILLAEAWHDGQIGDAVKAIQAKREATQNSSTPLSLVLIAGPSSSGKTTFCAKLSMHLRCAGIKPETLSTDDYFLARADERHPRDEKGQLNFECVEAVDVDKLNADMKRLFAGETVETPIFNFVNGAPEPSKTRAKKLAKGGVLVMEGIFCLNPKLTPHIHGDAKFGIFIAPMSPLRITNGSDLREDYVRLVRRISRDFLHRGNSAIHTLKKYESVRKGEQINIFPFVSSAEFIYNSSLIYELNVLKTKVKPLLEQISEEEASQAQVSELRNAILALLESFEGTEANEVPNTSVLMEFIGTSVFEE
mmetsp:Transcript_102230/g.218865  ORF Transcript_102230/g.218865 Transcript_102230/m.218865 type:complete len:369 (-) Transcript_102230:167-1273(-)